ncbi:MAG: arylsulfatase [Phycisphaerales bacterium]|jgi:arylsulfatase A-like enzyme|nr:arylsulfatase [Phycisphaerales bacterium]
MKRRAFLKTLTASAACAAIGGKTLLAKADKPARPNIMVIMADDLGYSDIGCYGGEIETPNLDALAKNGLRFSQFYNSARCCPTRASMLTGCYQHKVGLAHNGNNLSKNAVTIAEVLKTAGYQTGMTGKWHLSRTKPRKRDEQLQWLSHRRNFGPFAPLDTYPCNRGFDEHYGVIWGVVNYFDPFTLVHNEEQITEVPKDFYITDFITDKTVGLLDDYSKKDAPFFMYVAHTAPHWPLHAKPADIAKYKNRYKGGWDKLREDRYKRLLKSGLFDKTNTTLPPNSSGKAWDKLTDADKAYEAEIMSVHAAMVDCVDQGIGRIIKKLKETGQFDNTLILFFADNGASPERGYPPGFDRNGHKRDGTPVNYKARTGLGSEDTYPYLGRPWSNAVNSPFRYWKAESYEGGCHTPMIAHWPKGLKTRGGQITHQVGHVMDVMPTCLELARAEYPTVYKGKKIVPMDGKSLLPILQGKQRTAHEGIFFEHAGGRAARMGDWKISARRGGKPFELFNLAKDRTESTDLAKEHPQRLQAMTKAWNQWAKSVGLRVK